MVAEIVSKTGEVATKYLYRKISAGAESRFGRGCCLSTRIFDKLLIIKTQSREDRRGRVFPFGRALATFLDRISPLTADRERDKKRR